MLAPVGTPAGVVMGTAMADVALETVDVTLTADDLKNLTHVLKPGKRNQSAGNQNLALKAIVIGVRVIVRGGRDLLATPCRGRTWNQRVYFHHQRLTDAVSVKDD